MKVLFFLEPSIEHGNPYFRYATLRNSIVPQAKSLKDSHEITLVASEHIVNKAIAEGYNQFFDSIIGINSIEWEQNESSANRLVRYQKNKITSTDIGHIKRNLSALLNNDAPDLIIVWESPAYYFNEIYPNTKVLYQTPGFFSRPPYSSLIMFDEALLHSGFSNNDEVDKNSLDNLEAVRKIDKAFLEKYSPLKKYVDQVYKEFDRVILYPLQIDNYFMINALLPVGRTQFDILIETLKNTPQDVGVWVTNYKSKDIQSAVLSVQNIAYLRSYFPNFIYFEETDNIPYVSQFLVPELDGVVTISSSVGYQAAYYKKQLYLLGEENQLSNFSSSLELEQFFENVKNQKTNNKDNEIINQIHKKHLSVEFVNSSQFQDWLVEYVETGEFTNWCNDVGTELLSLRRESNLLKDIGYFERSHDDITNDFCNPLSVQLKNHDVISFDIFDTLLCRPFKNPSDLFKFIEPEVHAFLGSRVIDFYRLRKSSEAKAFKKSIEEGVGEISLEKIYAEIADELKLDTQQTIDLMQIEMNAELKFLYPRKSGLAAFNEAIISDKKVILVSDMYLSESFLAKVLEKNGYVGYQKLFVSSTYGAKKHNGKLFDVVLEELSHPASSILHVGDNAIGDVKQAKSRGLSTYHLVKAMDLFVNNSTYLRPWLRDENNHSIDWKMILAIIAQRLHDNPVKTYRKGTVFNGDQWQLGYVGLGVLLLGYTKWLIESAIRDGIEVLYFLARDGKIMKEAYDIVSKSYANAPKSVYMLCSRRSINLAKVKNLADIKDLLYVDFAHRVSLGHLLENRFGLTHAQVSNDILQKYGFTWSSRVTKDDLPRLDQLVTSIADEIITVATTERVDYLEYLDQIEIFKPNLKVAIVDIGYAGTMQESLYQISGKNISGYYLITFRKALERLQSNGLKSYGYLAEFIDRHDTYHPFCRHVPLYETLFSSTDNSFLKMSRTWDGNLQPIYMPDIESEEKRINFVRGVHSGALEFISDSVEILGDALQKMDIEPNKTMRLLDQLFNDPHPEDARLFSGIVFEDAYGGTQQKIILPNDEDIDLGGVWKRGIEIIKKDLSLKNGVRKDKAPGTTKAVNKQTADGENVLHADRSFAQRIVYKLLTTILSERKKRKFIQNPKLFFYDSKSLILTYVGKWYCKNA